MKQDERLQALGELIAASPVNLVARGERGRIGLHIEESVQIADALDVEAGASWMDLGTGGGLPGLVLALRHTDTRFTLVDAERRKVEQVEGFIRALALDNVGTVWGRAEELARSPEHRGAYDGVVARALAPLVTVVELARGFCRPGGVIAAVKGPAVAQELGPLERLADTLAIGSLRPMVLAGAPRPTTLVVMDALGAAPEAIPRRTGVPQRRPLG